MFHSIFEDGSLQDYINQNVQDPWIGTHFEGYVFMSPRHKGIFGERFVSKYFVLRGSKVEKPKNTGHDRIIDDKFSEIKFSLATRGKKGKINEDQFIINHVSKCKDWERLVFFGINPSEEDCRLFWFSKEDFIQHLESDKCLFEPQQAGKTGGNDDYICKNINKLRSMPFVKSIDQW